jgi:hypothetical protein
VDLQFQVHLLVAGGEIPHTVEFSVVGTLSKSARKVDRLFFLAALQSDDHGVCITEDATHHPFRRETPAAIGIDKTLIRMHTSLYTNLNTPKTEKTLSFLLVSHFLVKIYPLNMQKSRFIFAWGQAYLLDNLLGGRTALQ